MAENVAPLFRNFSRNSTVLAQFARVCWFNQGRSPVFLDKMMDRIRKDPTYLNLKIPFAQNSVEPDVFDDLMLVAAVYRLTPAGQEARWGKKTLASSGYSQIFLRMRQIGPYCGDIDQRFDALIQRIEEEYEFTVYEEERDFTSRYRNQQRSHPANLPHRLDR